MGRIGLLTPDSGGSSLCASVFSLDSFDGCGKDFLDHDVVGLLGNDIATPSTVLHDEEPILGEVFLLLVESLSILLHHFCVLLSFLVGKGGPESTATLGCLTDSEASAGFECLASHLGLCLTRKVEVR